MAAPHADRGRERSGRARAGGPAGASGDRRAMPLPAAQPGQIDGRVIDASGAPLPGVTCSSRPAARPDGGHRRARASTSCRTCRQRSGHADRAADRVRDGPPRVQFDQRGQQVDMTLSVGAVAESVTVTAETPQLNAQTSQRFNISRTTVQQAAEASRTSRLPSTCRTCSAAPRGCCRSAWKCRAPGHHTGSSSRWSSTRRRG